jgi:hypothetical protein
MYQETNNQESSGREDRWSQALTDLKPPPSVDTSSLDDSGAVPISLEEGPDGLCLPKRHAVSFNEEIDRPDFSAMEPIDLAEVIKPRDLKFILQTFDFMESYIQEHRSVIERARVLVGGDDRLAVHGLTAADCFDLLNRGRAFCWVVKQISRGAGSPLPPELAYGLIDWIDKLKTAYDSRADSRTQSLGERSEAIATAPIWEQVWRRPGLLVLGMLERVFFQPLDVSVRQQLKEVREQLERAFERHN